MYIDGKWKEAKKLFETIAQVKGQPDYPSSNILAVMEETNFVAPAKWPGYRVLTEK
jgi:hypothetical protein